MCRLYGFIANEETKVDCSLVYAQNALLLQSRVDEIGRDHADGWGIATYSGNQPTLIRNTVAAFEDRSFGGEAERIYTRVSIAHVRKATIGETSVHNTHPFRCGHFVFAHNGTVTGFESLESHLVNETDTAFQCCRHGTTDSEQFFLWLLSGLQKQRLIDEADRRFVSDLHSIRNVLFQMVRQLDQRCRSAAVGETPRLNFLLTDGTAMIACRWNNTLNSIRRRGLYECEICGIPHIHHHETVDHMAVAYASESITSEGWIEMPNESIEAIELKKDQLSTVV